MGFGDSFNWMTDKLKQGAPVMTPAGKACRGSYDLGCSAFSKINYGAEKRKGYCPDSQSAFNAAAFAGDVVITEFLRGIPGGPIICMFAQDGLRSLHWGMKSGHGHLANIIKEMKNRIEKLEEDNMLWTQQKRSPHERMKQSASSSRTLHLGSIMEHKPKDVKAFLIEGFEAGVILFPLVVSNTGEIEKL